MSAANAVDMSVWLDLGWIGLIGGLLLLACELPALSHSNLLSRRFASLLLEIRFKCRIFGFKCANLFIFLRHNFRVSCIRFFFFFPLALVKLSLLGVDLLIKSRVFTVLDTAFQFFKKGANGDGYGSRGHGVSSLSNDKHYRDCSAERERS